MRNQPDNNNNNFTTSDFYAAAFLMAKGYKLLGIDKADSRRFHFIFTDEPYRPQLVSAFFAGLIEVNAKAFVTGIKELKSLMYNDAMS